MLLQIHIYAYRKKMCRNPATDERPGIAKRIGSQVDLLSAWWDPNFIFRVKSKYSSIFDQPG